MKNYVAEVHWICPEEGIFESLSDYAVLQAEGYGDAATKIEKFYKDEIVWVQITEVSEDSIIMINEDTYKSFLNGDLG